MQKATKKVSNFYYLFPYIYVYGFCFGLSCKFYEQCTILLYIILYYRHEFFHHMILVYYIFSGNHNIRYAGNYNAKTSCM